MTAIQKDVEAEKVETTEQEIKPSPREEMMKSIVARAEQERAEEMGDPVEKPDDKEDKVEPVDEPEEPEAKDEVIEEPEVKLPDTVKIKVDGVEMEVPREKIVDAGIRTLQKESSADRRLEEATRLLREVHERIAPPKQEPEPSPKWDDQTIAYALEHGTEEQKAYAVGQLRGRDNATPEQIIQYAEQRVLDKVDFQNSSEWFLNEYKDITSDPYLFNLAAMEENRLRSTGDTRPRKDLYKDIGETLRKWRGGFVASQSLDDKKEQKSKIVNLPSASAKKTVPEDAKPKSASDIIEEMRKRRGQA